MRNVLSVGVALGLAVLLASWLAVESRAQAPEKSSLAGIWTRNHELSDPLPARGEAGDARGRGAGRDGHGGRGGHGGGFGGGGYGRGGAAGGGRAATVNPEEAERLRQALRTILDPGDRLTITQTDSMVVLTDQDGGTTRLSPDGKKVKDENTHIERKTRWEAGKIISEISGARPGKITQTFSVDPDARQLRIAVHVEGGRDNQQRTITHVYDAEAK